MTKCGQYDKLSNNSNRILNYSVATLLFSTSQNTAIFYIKSLKLKNGGVIIEK